MNKKVVIIGGGLAGLATAVRLSCANQGLPESKKIKIELHEHRKVLGGRAASFLDSDSGSMIDHCQHVAMKCCTFFSDFCDQAGISNQLKTLKRLHFFLPNAKRLEFSASRLLPAPFQFTTSLLAFSNFSIAERISIGRVALRLARTNIETDQTTADWLRKAGQTERVISEFWSTFLVSALGERVERVSLRAAKKVFIDGFLKNRDAFQVIVPQDSLRRILDDQVGGYLQTSGVKVVRESYLKNISKTSNGEFQLQGLDSQSLTAEACVVSLPWFRIASCLDERLKNELDLPKAILRNQPSPISGIHLWFDSPITDLSHAILIGRTAHWVFNGDFFRLEKTENEHYFQVVISSDIASELTRDEIVAIVLDELESIFPDAKAATLLRSKFIEEKKAVFSYTAGLDDDRPSQRTCVTNLYLAGDWTKTGWPSTMESAIRSGYYAANALLYDFGLPEIELPAELPSSFLAKLMFR